MSRLHEMKLQKQKDNYRMRYGKPAGDIDFNKNPFDEFEQKLKKKYGSYPGEQK